MAHAFPAIGLILVCLGSLACGGEAMPLGVVSHLLSDENVTLAELPGRRRPL